MFFANCIVRGVRKSFVIAKKRDELGIAAVKMWAADWMRAAIDPEGHFRRLELFMCFSATGKV